MSVIQEEAITETVESLRVEVDTAAISTVTSEDKSIENSPC